jgi:amino acid transporter
MDEKLNIPSIGAAKGLFEMLVPGVFLLLNLGFFLNYLSAQYWEKSLVFDIVKGNTALVLIAIIVLGYLIGVVLWIIGADIPDFLSTKLRRSGQDPYYEENFPYINSLGSIIKLYLPLRQEISI